MNFKSFTPHPGNLKGSLYFLGKFAVVIYMRDSHQFLPPVWCVNLATSPLQPDFIILYRGLWWQVMPPSVHHMEVRPPSKCSSSGSRVGGGPRLHFLASPLLGAYHLCHLIKGSSLQDDSRLQKVTRLLGLVGLGLGDWVHLPLEFLQLSPLTGVWVHLHWHPLDHFFKWPLLWECQ